MASSIKIRVSINGSTTDYRLPAGVRTASQLAASSQFRDDFSLGANITVLVNGIETEGTLASNDVITVRVNAARKAR